MDTLTDFENPFVMGRSLLVLVLIELITSLVVYVFFL